MVTAKVVTGPQFVTAVELAGHAVALLAHEVEFIVIVALVGHAVALPGHDVEWIVTGSAAGEGMVTLHVIPGGHGSVDCRTRNRVFPYSMTKILPLSSTLRPAGLPNDALTPNPSSHAFKPDPAKVVTFLVAMTIRRIR